MTRSQPDDFDTDEFDTNENVLALNIYPSKPKDTSNIYAYDTNRSIRSPRFHSLDTKRRFSTDVVSPNKIRMVGMDRNPFNTMDFEIIPGPISLRCDNIQFAKSWIKYIFQSAITVASHTISFLITILWIRFLFSSYYEFQYQEHDTNNDISSYTLSILSYLPFSSWIWIAICLTNIVFVLGFMIQTWIIPVQCNFEDNSNTKLFRYFGISFILIVIILIFIFSVLQMLSYSIFYIVSTISQVMIALCFSFILLFVIIKHGEKAAAWNYPNAKEDDADARNDIDLSTDPSEITTQQIYTNIKRKSKRNIIAALSNNRSCFKLSLICTLFAFIITATIASFYINFHFVLSFILNHNSNKYQSFDDHFLIHLIVTIFGTLLIGDLLILFMRILMRWLTIVLSGSYGGYGSQRHSISFSQNAHYGSMQPFNRMILFAIPLMFITKLGVFVVLYTFIDPIEFAVSITVFCIFSRCFRKLFMKIEDNVLNKLIGDDEFDVYDDQNTLRSLQDYHFLAQCDYIHDIIHYISTLLIPLMFALFGVNIQNDESVLPVFHYVQTAFIQFMILCIFDLVPFLIVLMGNPRSTYQESFYHLSQNIPIVAHKASESRCCGIRELALNLKVQYINMMNGWTATDKCVPHYMWWCTIFIGGYFAFYLMYPQQFLCVTRYDRHSVIFDNWIYIQCQ